MNDFVLIYMREGWKRKSLRVFATAKTRKIGSVQPDPSLRKVTIGFEFEARVTPKKKCRSN